MIENVRHHVKEEESELFPTSVTSRLAPSCSSSGSSWRQGRGDPTRPTPGGLDTPPVNVVAAPIASALDHAREVGKDVAKRVRTR